MANSTRQKQLRRFIIPVMRNDVLNVLRQASRPSSSCSRDFPLVSIYMYSVLTISFLSITVGEDAFQRGDDDETADDKIRVMNEDDQVVDEAWFMLLVLSLLFGFFMTLFAAWIGYFSALEDQLMWRYLVEGQKIVARVVSSDFAGDGNITVNPNYNFEHRYTNHSISPQGLSQDIEYICFCEYEQTLARNYTVCIRKQCKAKASDIVGADQMLQTLPNSDYNNFEFGHRLGRLDPTATKSTACCVVEHVPDDLDKEGVGGDGACNENGIVRGRHFLKMLLLPGHERSAYPQNAVQRACSTRYRCSTVGLVLFCVGLAASCTFWAIHEVQNLKDADQRLGGWKAVGVYFVFVALELPFIRGCCHGFFVDALREEYLESGDFVPLHDDASSLSSASDLYNLSTPARHDSSSYQV